MPITSYVICCPPPHQSSVRERLAQMPGVELGQSTDFGFPVVVESATSREASEIGEDIQALTGVKSAVLVYHNFEDVLDWTMPHAAPSAHS